MTSGPVSLPTGASLGVVWLTITVYFTSLLLFTSSHHILYYTTYTPMLARDPPTMRRPSIETYTGTATSLTGLRRPIGPPEAARSPNPVAVRHRHTQLCVDS